MVTGSTGMVGSGAIVNNAFYYIGFLITAQAGTSATNVTPPRCRREQRFKTDSGYGTPPSTWPVGKRLRRRHRSGTSMPPTRLAALEARLVPA